MKPVSPAPGRRVLRRALLLASFALAAASPARAVGSDDVERRRLADERAAIEAAFAARQRECRERFVVTSCVDDARRQRRSGLDALRARQLELDEARRRERTAERRAELAAKAAEDARREQQRAAHAASAPAQREPPRPLEPRHASAPSASPRIGSVHDQPSSPGQRLGLKPEHRETPEQRQEREASSRASFEAHQRQAEEHRQNVLERAARRLKDHPPAAPLPTPSAPAR